jgi:hypothetical protein
MDVWTTYILVNKKHFTERLSDEIYASKVEAEEAIKAGEVKELQKTGVHVHILDLYSYIMYREDAARSGADVDPWDC